MSQIERLKFVLTKINGQMRQLTDLKMATKSSFTHGGKVLCVAFSQHETMICGDMSVDIATYRQKLFGKGGVVQAMRKNVVVP